MDGINQMSCDRNDKGVLNGIYSSVDTRET